MMTKLSAPLLLILALFVAMPAVSQDAVPTNLRPSWSAGQSATYEFWGKTEKAEGVTDAVGTIGLFDNIKAVRGGYWVCFKATLAALCSLPYCIKRRKVCKHEDFELPLR